MAEKLKRRVKLTDIAARTGYTVGDVQGDVPDGMHAFVLSAGLKRLADLIQCEMTMRNHYDKASITNQITGEYKDFNIYHAYSTIRVQAKGKVNQLLPFPQLSDVNVFDRTLNRIVYRGY